MSIKNWIRRWRHTRGYGVHSPLAYAIVKDCICPDRQYGFYCDPYIDFEYHEDRRAGWRARMIIRLLHLLRPSHVWIPAADKRLVTAIHMIMPRMRISTRRECPEGTDFMVLFDMADTPRLWHKMDTLAECSLLAFGPPCPVPEKVTLELSSSGFLLLLRRLGMQKVRYEV